MVTNFLIYGNSSYIAESVNMAFKLSDDDCTEHSLVPDTPTDTALQELYDSFEKTKAVPHEFKELLAKIHEIPQLKDEDIHDKEVAGSTCFCP